MATINIPQDIFERVVRAAHAATPQEAVLQALEEFAWRHDQSQLVPLLGTSDGFMTSEELDAIREMD